MNPQIDQYKSKSKYFASDNYYHYNNEEDNDAVLAFKYDDKTAFLVEYPNSNDLQQFAELLEVKESNFLYISHHSSLLYAVRKDKSYYVVTLFTEITTKECIITNKNSVKIIAERFLEDSLFDGRANEKRYLMEENWYDYEAPQAVEHPLQGQALQNIGKDLTPIALLQMDMQPISQLKSPAHYENEFQMDYSRIQWSPHDKTLEIQQIEEALSYEVNHFSLWNGTIFIEYPYTEISKKKLEKLPFNYRYINQNQWYIFVNTEKEAHNSYFIVVQFELNDKQYYQLDIRGYHPNLFDHIFEDLHTLERLSIGLARPLRKGEQTAKSISVDYSLEEQRFVTSLGHHLTKNELLEFLDEWVD